MSFIKDNRLLPFDSFRPAADLDFTTVVPPGWAKLLHFAEESAGLLGGIVKRVRRDQKGLFRVESISLMSDTVTRGELLRRINDTIAQESARVCMVCGKSGFRRKMEEGWPCLCRDHYIVYANALADEGT